MTTRHVLTTEDRRAGGKARMQLADAPAHQVAAGRRGYIAACARHGEERILAAAIAKQRAHPSRLERELLTILADIDAPAYEHIHQPWPDRRYTVDVAWPAERRAIEVLGAVHFRPDLTGDPGRFDRLQAKLAALAADGWQVLLVECPANHLPDDTRDRVSRFLADLVVVPF